MVLPGTSSWPQSSGASGGRGRRCGGPGSSWGGRPGEVESEDSFRGSGHTWSSRHQHIESASPRQPPQDQDKGPAQVSLSAVPTSDQRVWTLKTARVHSDSASGFTVVLDNMYRIVYNNNERQILYRHYISAIPLLSDIFQINITTGFFLRTSSLIDKCISLRCFVYKMQC